MRSFKSLIRIGGMSALLLLVSFSMAVAQVTVSGTVTDGETQSAIPGANVVVENTVIGTATDRDGGFSLTTSQATPFNLIVSSIGYQTQTISVSASMSGLEVVLEPATLMAGEVVVSASRVEESILKSPVSIEKMDLLEIRNTASASMWDGLKNVREVEVVANSMFFKSVRSRGYGSASNVNFKQYVDGVDNAPVANGQFALGNLAGLSDIDVESIEVLPGAASALYGPSAFSGIMFMNSKNPFYHQGLSVQVGSGANNESRAGTTPHYNVALRYGKALNERFAFKIVGDYIKATDWYAYDLTDKGGSGTTSHAGNPVYDGLNVYGDDYTTDLTGVRDALIGLGLLPATAAGIPLGPNTRVSRTGYDEADLFNYDDAFNMKVSAGLYYRVNENLEASFKWRYGTGSAVYQGTNRYALDGLNNSYYIADLTGKNLLLRAFYTKEDAGDSYDIVFAGWNVNRTWSSDLNWFGEYTGAYIQTLGATLGATGTLTPADYDMAHAGARAFADRNRYEPGSADFENALETIQLRKDFATGAGFRSESAFFNVEGQYDFTEALGGVIDLQVGGNMRQYDVNTFGTIYSDADGEGFNVTEWGTFAQIGKTLGNLRLQGSIRADGHTNFDTEMSPRISAVYTVNDTHNFRASYQSAILNPTIEAQYINLNLGPIVLIGGSPDNAGRTGREDLFNGGAITAEQVGALQAGAITPNQLTPISVDFRTPAKLSEYSVGYKALITDNLFLDLTYWDQTYTDFFAQQTVFSATELQQSLADPNFSPLAYRVYTSSQDQETKLHGIGATLTYDFTSGLRLSGNYSFQDLYEANLEDFLDDTNTPKNKFSVSLGHRSITDNLGFNVTMRYRDGFYWNSSFGEGDLPSVTTVDAQLTYSFPQLGSRLKVGANNIGGTEYFDAYGSVSIGSTYYITYTVDQLFK